MGELSPCPFCGHAARVFHDMRSDNRQHWTWVAECFNLGDCEAEIGGFASRDAAIAHWNRRADTARVLAEFYNRVCDRAEANMAATGTISGAHWNAMRQELSAMGITVAQ